MSMLKKLLGWVATLLAGALLLVALYSMIVPSPLPFFGTGFYTVLSGSMEPAIATGSMAVVRQAAPADIQVGDIITFTVADTVLTHRVVEIEEQNDSLLFHTQGDANNQRDNPVSQDQVIGRVSFSIVFLGRIIQWIRTPAGIAVLVFLLGLLVISLFWSKSSKDKTPDEDEPGGDKPTDQIVYRRPTR